MAFLLTTNHLIYGRNIRTKSSAVFQERSVMNDQLKRFSKVFLNELQQHYVSREEKHSKNNVFKVGDIILIKGEKNVPHTQWRIGKIS